MKRSVSELSELSAKHVHRFTFVFLTLAGFEVISSLSLGDWQVALWAGIALWWAYSSLVWHDRTWDALKLAETLAENLLPTSHGNL